MYILGFDIGGTKCAVVTAEWNGEHITIIKKVRLSTDHSIDGYGMLDKLISAADSILERTPDRIGISCGGPLDSENGIIMSPPNLPGWDNIKITDVLQKRYGVKAYLQNDANACALAEWKFGAGKGCKNMIFLTFGTGFGAGLIINNAIYEGTNGNAGEIGHIRIADDGPVGYGKAGSLEGFCSGGGIAQLGLALAKKKVQSDIFPLYYQKGTPDSDVTARSIAEAAMKDDQTAIEVFRISGKYLGKGLSILIDLLNPEAIVIGSIFERSGSLLVDSMNEEIKKEALPMSGAVCRVKPSGLGDSIGDYAAIATVFS